MANQFNAGKKVPATKKFNTGAPAKAGSRSEGHRGFHGDAAPVKKRWTQDDRAARTGDRPASTDRRPNWTPTNERPARPAYGDRPQRTERPAYGDRTERPSYGDRPQRTERPSYGDRPQRTERPSYGDRPARPSYNDRPARPSQSDRPTYGDRPARSNDDRPARTERPSYNDRPARSYDDRPARTERPSYGDRPARTDRPAQSDRPSYGDRPARSYDDRPARTERPSYNDRPARTERPSYNDRPARTERPSYGDRPQRSFEDRAPRRDSDYYPAKHDTKSAVFAAHEDVVLERLEAKVITAGDAAGTTWKDLGIGDNMTRQLIAMGAESPFPIQAATIPDVLAGKDVLGRGRTGSGKTIAFGAPLVERLMSLWADSGKSGGKRQMGRKPRALILAPTRELALQIDRTVQPIARSVGLFTTQIYGGVPQARQVGALQRGVDIVIGTPGRIEDLIEQGRLDLSEVVITVLDEADHMCDLGFLEPVQRILRETADGGQKLLFSATLDKGVAQLVDEFLPEPSVHEVAGEDQSSSTIDHRVLVIEHRDKGAIIEQLADR
ncbi:MAG: box helicase, partial [Microbacteriaceae bacterium]|nr:box helicase [Microbacteriaceae bacterium]